MAWGAIIGGIMGETDIHGAIMVCLHGGIMVWHEGIMGRTAILGGIIVCHSWRHYSITRHGILGGIIVGILGGIIVGMLCLGAEKPKKLAPATQTK